MLPTTSFIISPFVGVPLAAEKSFAQQLSDDVGADNVQTILKPDSHICIWYAPLNRTLVAQYKANPIVSSPNRSAKPASIICRSSPLLSLFIFLFSCIDADHLKIQTVELDSPTGNLFDDVSISSEIDDRTWNYDETDSNSKTHNGSMMIARDGSVERQTNAPQELKVASQPKADFFNQGEAN
jgi:hypothetical protein